MTRLSPRSAAARSRPWRGRERSKRGERERQPCTTDGGDGVKRDGGLTAENNAAGNGETETGEFEMLCGTLPLESAGKGG